MSMNADQLQERVKALALRILKLVDALPNTIAGREIGRQLLRAGMSVSANYRAARRARSRKEFVAKICIVAEEADEVEHWLDLILESELLPTRRVKPLHRESLELMKIFAATRRSMAGSKSQDGQIARSPNGAVGSKSPNRQIARSPNGTAYANSSA